MKIHSTFKLRKLILKDLNAEQHQITEQEISVWMDMLPDITEEIFDTIFLFTYTVFPKNLAVRQIRQLRQEYIRLMDQLDGYPEMPAMMDDLKFAAIKCLDLVLEKIHTDCKDYLNDHILMPALHLKHEKVAIAADMNLLAALLKNGNADTKLQQLIVDSMTELLKEPGCYYDRLAYVKQLQFKLIGCCKTAGKANINEQLISHLLSVNYNTAGFVQYCQQKITNKLATCIEEEEQYRYLQLCEYNFGNPHYKKSALGYDPKLRRVNQILYSFVRLELSMREKRRVKQIRKELNQAAQHSKSDTGSYRIRTPLTVSALTYFMRLMVEAKVIEPGIKTELFAFLSKTFETPNCGSGGISAGSMATKYKNVVQTTAVSVRVVLLRMLKNLNDEFE